MCHALRVLMCLRFEDGRKALLFFQQHKLERGLHRDDHLISRDSSPGLGALTMRAMGGHGMRTSEEVTNPLTIFFEWL